MNSTIMTNKERQYEYYHFILTAQHAIEEGISDDDYIAYLNFAQGPSIAEFLKYMLNGNVPTAVQLTNFYKYIWNTAKKENAKK